MKDYYTNLTVEHYEDIMDRYRKFISKIGDVNSKPNKVYKTLTQKRIDDISMIREMSKELQLKKDEDMKKAAQAAAEAEKVQEEKKTEEEKIEEVPEADKEN